MPAQCARSHCIESTGLFGARHARTRSIRLLPERDKNLDSKERCTIPLVTPWSYAPSSWNPLLDVCAAFAVAAALHLQPHLHDVCRRRHHRWKSRKMQSETMPLLLLHLLFHDGRRCWTVHPLLQLNPRLMQPFWSPRLPFYGPPSLASPANVPARFCLELNNCVFSKANSVEPFFFESCHRLAEERHQLRFTCVAATDYYSTISLLLIHAEISRPA